MKTKLPLMLSILLICFSCQTNDDLENDNSALDKTDNVLDTRGSLDSPNSNKEAFESMMQWTAYMTAQALYHDADAEGQFMSVLHTDSTSPYKIIKLEDLLGHNVVNESFKSAFKEQFFKYVDLECDDSDTQDFGESTNDDGNTEGPIEGNPKPQPPIEIANPDTCEGAFNNFLAALLDYNCLEFFLPLSYDDTTNEFTSTSHPLTGHGQNECYLHPIDSNSTTMIKASNLAFRPNPIMVRPVRSAGPIGGECLYEEYEGIDFTLFLN